MKGTVLPKGEPPREGQRQLGIGAPATLDSRRQIHTVVSREATPLEHYVSADAVAAHLSVERRVVLNLARRGRIPAHALDPNAAKKIWRFKLSEIDALLTKNPLGSRR